MHIIILETALFDDSDGVERALQTLAATHQLSRYNLRRTSLTDHDWDDVLAAVLAGDTVVTV